MNRLFASFRSQSSERMFTTIGSIVGISVIYALLRLIALKFVPPFVDELIHVQWAQLGFYNPAMRMISLADGKQPLFIWLISILMNLLPNPLVAGRAISILAGFGTLLGIGAASWLLFKERWVAFLGMFMYAVLPFALIHDRVVLYDSLLACFFTWILVTTLWMVKAPSLGKAFIVGHVLGAAFLTKSSSNLFLFLIPLTLALFAPKRNMQTLRPLLFYSMLSIALGLLYASILLLSPGSANIAGKNSQFIVSYQAVFQPSEIQLFIQNFSQMVLWLTLYVGVPILLLFFTPLFSKTARTREYFFTVCCFVFPCIIEAAIAKRPYPRYMFFTIPPLIMASSYALWQVLRSTKYGVVKIVLLCIAFFWCLYADGAILTHFQSAPIPTIDRLQFITGWSAGYGISDIIKYLQKQAMGGSIVIAAEGTYGSLPRTAAEVYFFQLPSVKIVSFEVSAEGTIPLEITTNEHAPVYIIFNTTQEIPPWPMEKVMEIRKGNGGNYIRLYRYTPVATLSLGGR